MNVRVTHVNFRSNQGKNTATIFKEQENEKKSKYKKRVMDVEMWTFTPLVFGTNGGMGFDCQNFLRTLANKLSSKNNEPYASVISWLWIFFIFNLCKYLRIYSLKVVNITNYLIPILKIVRLIVSIISISISIIVVIIVFSIIGIKLLVLVFTYR